MNKYNILIYPLRTDKGKIYHNCKKALLLKITSCSAPSLMGKDEGVRKIL